MATGLKIPRTPHFGEQAPVANVALTITWNWRRKELCVISPTVTPPAGGARVQVMIF